MRPKFAEQWNARDHGIGYVTRFEVHVDFMRGFPVQKVGGIKHTEWWIPAEDLEALNDRIVGTIEVISEHRTQSTQKDGAAGTGA